MIETTDWLAKVWGRTRCVARGPNFEVHYLEINKGFRCSRHRHKKWNQFHVLEGELHVQFYSSPPADDWHKPKALEPTSSFVIAEHREFQVSPGLWHRFETRSKSAKVLEVYWTDAISADDIQRFDEGGML